MTRRIITAFLIVILISISLPPAGQSRAQAGTPAQMIAIVNALRASYGLAPLQTDPTLMSIAQAHSDYQASIGSVTHVGPGGSRPRDRAAAAGFGSGATIFVSENIAGGMNMSAETAVYTHWQDALHLNTMIGENYVYIGAGVGFAGDVVYYTIDVGYYSGAPTLQPGTDESTAVPPVAGANPQPTAFAYDPFILSTPRPDGAVIHVVGAGQTLVGIAEMYDIPLSRLLEQNFMTMDSVIYPNEELIIVPSGTPQVDATNAITGTNQITTTGTITTATALTETAQLTVPTPSPTPTRAPTQTARPSSTPEGDPADDATTDISTNSTGQNAAIIPSDIVGDNQLLMYIAIGLSFIVLVAVLISGFTNKPPEPPRTLQPKDEEK